MSVAFDAVGSNSVAGSAGNTLTWTHTPVGTPTAVSVALFNYNGTVTVSTVKYGSTNLSSAISVADGDSSAQIWGLANPPSGAQTVTITFSGTDAYTLAGSVTVTGSDTGTCFRNSNSNTSTGTSASCAVTTVSGDLVVDIIADILGFTWTKGASQSLDWGPLEEGGSNTASGSHLAASTTSTTMTWTTGLSGLWVQAAAAFKVAGGGAGPVVTSCSPNKGTSSGGTSVTISGSGFTGATGVTFGGSSATSVVVVSDISITCVTPSHAVGFVDVAVTTASGTGTETNGYMYYQAIAAWPYRM